MKDVGGFDYGVGHEHRTKRSDSRFMHSFYKQLLPTLCQAMSAALEYIVEQDKVQFLDENYIVVVYLLKAKPIGHADAFDVGR